MDDNDVCPLCCEELDISDQQFFPCKCGYQVCMWCWHRIKESESGLCPACRTPYGDDPHEFSAVDMEEVVKANKEKAAAEKREKDRLRAQAAAASGNPAAFSVAGMHIGGGSDGDLAVATAGGNRGHLEPPKDRNQLAVMRVIRRNLVYAVGLPPSIATEEILRKPEYFGQYGKISKIVLNRSHTGNGDPRRASASAYVTFAHKEDALACILALDGFYVDGRNIRASYGTSKYCSAFIKNVRCNNPDCTYLHCMGDSEDTFTKQEIQAGYVTSGRDVLARQQQMSAGTNSRRKVGSGGPSGTGKVATNPVFPPPTFEEQSKPSQTNLVPPPPATSSTTQFPPVSSAATVSRAASTSMTGFSAIAAGNAPTPASKMTRSSSVPLSTQATKNEPELTPAEMLSRQQEELRKKHPQNSTNANKKKNATTAAVSAPSNADNTPLPAPTPAPAPAPPSTTAASIVAGVHSTAKPTAPAPHTTLTALTPLKRATSLPEKKESKLSSLGNTSTLTPAQQANFITSASSRENSTKLDTLRSNSSTLQNGNGVGNLTSLKSSKPIGASSIGGSVIGGNSSLTSSNNSFGNRPVSNGLGGLSSLNSNPSSNNNTGGSLLGSLGSSSIGPNNNIGGQPIGGSAIGGGGNSVIGGSSILSQPLMSSFGETKTGSSNGLLGNNTSDFNSFGGGGLWDQPKQNMDNRQNTQLHQNNNNAIGGTMLSAAAPKQDGVSGSSALASMLGIELPTGVGSLRETLWASSTPLKNPSSETKTNAPTPIGAGIKKSSDGIIIGGRSSMSSAGGVPIGGYGSSVGPANNGNKNDIALLQSLLPGVHITSGNYQQGAPNAMPTGNPFGGPDSWGGLGGGVSQQQNQNIQSQKPIGELSNQFQDSWNGYPSAPGPKNDGRNQQRQPNIW
ncbi:CCR4-NOT transcription complex subunit 4 [Chaetoceros tenuissimus]|uniref:CCR4-NOT transcription complex subunit 4 n=1 Tax=Chaetoceros tenuissimus TaxID=426638 RepID=A0AAD3CMD3_9STRA|nr:CCR4-NOT transcription complex subunit 4 [Chaetoceros tenuissimus]